MILGGISSLFPEEGWIVTRSIRLRGSKLPNPGNVTVSPSRAASVMTWQSDSTISEVSSFPALMRWLSMSINVLWSMVRSCVNGLSVGVGLIVFYLHHRANLVIIFFFSKFYGTLRQPWGDFLIKNAMINAEIIDFFGLVELID